MDINIWFTTKGDSINNFAVFNEKFITDKFHDSITRISYR